MQYWPRRRRTTRPTDDRIDRPITRRQEWHRDSRLALPGADNRHNGNWHDASAFSRPSAHFPFVAGWLQSFIRFYLCRQPTSVSHDSAELVVAGTRMQSRISADTSIHQLVSKHLPSIMGPVATKATRQFRNCGGLSSNPADFEYLFHKSIHSESYPVCERFL